MSLTIRWDERSESHACLELDGLSLLFLTPQKIVRKVIFDRS